jgi:hypothetical protein
VIIALSMKVWVRKKPPRKGGRGDYTFTLKLDFQ